MANTPEFAPAEEEAFFACPCFQDDRATLEDQESGLVDDVLVQTSLRLVCHGICLNRAIYIVIKVLAKFIEMAPAQARKSLEQQVHDMLDLEMALRPSKD